MRDYKPYLHNPRNIPPVVRRALEIMETQYVHNKVCTVLYTRTHSYFINRSGAVVAEHGSRADFDAYRNAKEYVLKHCTLPVVFTLDPYPNETEQKHIAVSSQLEERWPELVDVCRTGNFPHEYSSIEDYLVDWMAQLPVDPLEYKAAIAWIVRRPAWERTTCEIKLSVNFAAILQSL